MTADERAVGTIQPGQIAVPVHNVERATAFYRDVLGLRYLCGAGQLSFFDCGGIRIMLDRPENKEFDHPSASLIFRCLMSRPCTSACSTPVPPLLSRPKSSRPCPITISGSSSSATPKATSCPS